MSQLTWSFVCSTVFQFLAELNPFSTEAVPSMVCPELPIPFLVWFAHSPMGLFLDHLPNKVLALSVGSALQLGSPCNIVVTFMRQGTGRGSLSFLGPHPNGLNNINALSHSSRGHKSKLKLCTGPVTSESVRDGQLQAPLLASGVCWPSLLLLAQIPLCPNFI